VIGGHDWLSLCTLALWQCLAVLSGAQQRSAVFFTGGRRRDWPHAHLDNEIASRSPSHVVSRPRSQPDFFTEEKNVPFHAPSVWGIAWGCGPRPQGELRGKADESGGTVGPQPFVPAQMAQRSAEYLPAVITHGTWADGLPWRVLEPRETAGGRGWVAKGS